MSKNRRATRSYDHSSRSPSSDRSRSRTRTYTHDEDSYSDYSDDFDGVSRKSTPSPPRSNRRRTKGHRQSPYVSDHTVSTINTSAASKKSTQSLGRRQGRNRTQPGRGFRSHSYTKDRSPKKTPRSLLRDTVASRMLSAKRHRINEINNELAETKLKLAEALKENRLLKTLQHRQDKAIRKFEDTESDLPRLISQHAEEERVLRAKLRKIKDSERALEHRLHEKEEDIGKMERTLRKLKKIVYDRNLGERSELARQLSDAENHLTVAERKVKELDKKLELTVSSYTRQLNNEHIKHKETKDKLYALHDEHVRLQHRLKEKERALEVSNIYSLRQKVSPEKALVPRNHLDSYRSNSYLHSSATQTDLALFPLPVENGQPAIADSSTSSQIMNNLSSPKSMSTQERQSRKDFRKTIKSPYVSEKDKDIENIIKHEDLSSQLNGLILQEKNNNRNENKESNIKSDSKRSVFLTANFDSPNSSRDNSFLSNSSKSPPVVDKPKPGPEKSQDAEQIALDVMLAEAKKAQELENQRKMENERQNKIALLARMREVEDQDSSVLNLSATKPDSVPPLKFSNKPKTQTNIVNTLFKDNVNVNHSNNNEVQPDKSISSNITPSKSNEPINQKNSNPKIDSPLRSRKSYQFSKEVENLHLGLPASREGSAKKAEREISFGSYAPTVGVTPARRKAGPKKTAAVTSSESDGDEPLFDLDSGKQKKKSDLLAQLFGEQASQNNQLPQPSKINPPAQITTESSNLSSRAKPIHSGYPWEKNVHTQGNGDGNLNMTSAPVVKAVPSFNEDDIEEVAL